MPVQSDTEKCAHDLDLKYPGSTFTQVLKSHGKDGRYLVLVVDPLSNFRTIFSLVSLSWMISCPKSNIQLEHQPEARVGHEPATFGVSFWSLGFFGLGKADSGSLS